MVRELIHDTVFLSLKSEVATEKDLAIAKDLADTLEFHREECVGMAGNMIGERKRIIAFIDEKGKIQLMLNPEILRARESYEAFEGCLSLLGGERKAKRYKNIKVRFQNQSLETRIKTYTGAVAQIIQHELDHCNGVLI